MLELFPAIALLAASLHAGQAAAPGAPPQSSPAQTDQAAPGLEATGPSRATRPPDFERTGKRRFDEPAEAQEFFLHQRLPAGEKRLPIERYFAARDRLRTMRQHSAHTGALLPSRAEMGGTAARDAASSGWTNIGPGNIGGRTLALAIDPGNPATMYAGTADGGIWKTFDTGASWQPVGDMLPSLAVSTLVMDPANSGVLYAGTGEGSFNGDAAQGAGVFQSVDAGDTWTQVAGSGTADFFFVNKLALSPATGHLYAATGTGVWRFNAAAGAWAQLLAPGTFLGCFDLALRADAAGNDVLLAACGSFSQGAVFRNSRAQVHGSPWQVVLTNAAMGRTSLAMAPSDPETVYAVVTSNANGPRQAYNQGLLGVWRSTQGGAAGSWQPRLLNTSHDFLSTLLFTNPVYAALEQCDFGPFSEYITQGWYDTVIAVDPVNPDVVWVGGIDLFRSDDGGQSFGAASYWWVQPDPPYNHADQHALAFPPGYNGASNQTLFIGNDGGVFVTRNSLAQTARGNVMVLCNDVNSKVVFQGLNSGFTATQFYDGAVYPDGSAYFGGTQDNGTVGGTDQAGANNWTTLIGGDGGFVAVDPTNADVLYGENTGLSIQKSIDGGKTFNFASGAIADNNFLFIAPFILDPTNHQRLYAGGSYLWRTANGAATWSRASARIAGALGASISAIAVSPVNSDQALTGTDQGVIQRSAAATTATGTTVWPKSQPRAGYVSWLAFDPANALVAYATYATFGGTHVWKTADGGATWTGIDGTGAGALPDLPVNSVAIDPVTSNLFIATDMGVFVSADGGQSWALELTGFPDSVVDALVMHVDASGRSLYAFTHGRGAWRVSLP
jgi:hypothetical protein